MVQKLPRLGRPREFDPDAVLDAAMRLFWARGFDQTSVEDLEAATQRSRSSLYNTFGSKRDLFGRALTRYLGMLDEALLAPLEHGVEGLADVRRFVDRLGSQLDDPGFIAGCLLTNSLAEFGGRDDEVTRHGRSYLERCRSAMTAALQRAAALGEVASSDVGPKADLFVGLVLGANVVARSGAGKAELSALTAAIHAEIAGWHG